MLEYERLKKRKALHLFVLYIWILNEIDKNRRLELSKSLSPTCGACGLETEEFTIWIH